MPTNLSYVVANQNSVIFEVDSIAISDRTVTLTLESATTGSDRIALSYFPPNAERRRIRDLAGNQAAALSSVAVRNLLTTDTLPTLTIDGASFAESAGDVEITVTLSAESTEDVTVDYRATTNTAGTEDFTLEADTLTIAAGATEGSIPIAIIDDLLDEEDEDFRVLLSDPSNAEFELGASNINALVIIIDDDTRPVLQTAEVNGATLVLDYDKALDEDSVPAVGDYDVRVDGTRVSVSSLAIDGMAVSLTLSRAVRHGQTVVLTYARDPATPVQDEAGNSVDVLRDRPVDNLTPDTTAPTLNSSQVVDATLTLTYNEPLDETSTPAAGDFSVTSAGSPVSLSGVELSGSEVILTLVAPAGAGDAVVLTYTPGADPIRDEAGNPAAALTSHEVVNNSADTTAPALNTAEVNGATLVLTYNEPLDETSTPAAGDFSVTSAGSAVSLSGVEVSGSQVTLTLASPVDVDDTVTLTYTPGTNPIRDTAELSAAALSGHSVVNNTPDTTAPVLQTSVVTDAAVTLTYDEPLDENSVPAAGDFSLTDAGTPVAVSSVAVSGMAVSLTLARDVGVDTAVILNYTPGADPIRDLAQNPAAALTGRSLDNDLRGRRPAGARNRDCGRLGADPHLQRGAHRVARSEERPLYRHHRLQRAHRGGGSGHRRCHGHPDPGAHGGVGRAPAARLRSAEFRAAAHPRPRRQPGGGL